MKKKIVKIIAASGLAVMMGVGTLCGVLIAPMGATASSNSANLAGAAQLGDSAVSASPLGLDPENDPVICTTESGLEIKFHQTVTDYYGGILEIGALAGYSYVTMGKYNNNPINWVVIGMSSSGLGGASLGVDWGIDQTPAGLAIEDSILNKLTNTTIVGDNNALIYYLNSVGRSDELEQGELLMLSEGILGTAKVATGSYNNSNNYSGSPLKSSIDAIANNFTDEEKTFIVPQTINSRYNGWGTNTVNNALLFPLATNYYFYDNTTSMIAYDSQNICNQSFCVEDYFSALKENFVEGVTTPEDPLLSATSAWWLRSGITTSTQGCSCFTANGRLISYEGTGNYFGVRPAFVLNLFA